MDSKGGEVSKFLWNDSLEMSRVFKKPKQFLVNLDMVQTTLFGDNSKFCEFYHGRRGDSALKVSGWTRVRENERARQIECEVPVPAAFVSSHYTDICIKRKITIPQSVADTLRGDCIEQNSNYARRA